MQANNHWLQQAQERGLSVDPIIKFDEHDFVIWGGESLQRKPTALDRVSARRMMLYIEKRVRQIVKDDMSVTKRAICEICDLLEDIRQKKGCSSYSIEWESPNKVKIDFTPIKAVDSIELNLEIKPI